MRPTRLKSTCNQYNLTRVLAVGMKKFCILGYPTGKDSDQVGLHYENMPIQIYWKFYHQKMKIFR